MTTITSLPALSTLTFHGDRNGKDLWVLFKDWINFLKDNHASSDKYCVREQNILKAFKREGYGLIKGKQNLWTNFSSILRYMFILQDRLKICRTTAEEVQYNILTDIKTIPSDILYEDIVETESKNAEENAYLEEMDTMLVQSLDLQETPRLLKTGGGSIKADRISNNIETTVLYEDIAENERKNAKANVNLEETDTMAALGLNLQEAPSLHRTGCMQSSIKDAGDSDINLERSTDTIIRSVRDQEHESLYPCQDGSAISVDDNTEGTKLSNEIAYQYIIDSPLQNKADSNITNVHSTCNASPLNESFQGCKRQCAITDTFQSNDTFVLNNHERNVKRKASPVHETFPNNNTGSESLRSFKKHGEKKVEITKKPWNSKFTIPFLNFDISSVKGKNYGSKLQTECLSSVAHGNSSINSTIGEFDSDRNVVQDLYRCNHSPQPFLQPATYDERIVYSRALGRNILIHNENCRQEIVSDRSSAPHSDTLSSDILTLEQYYPVAVSNKRNPELWYPDNDIIQEMQRITEHVASNTSATAVNMIVPREKNKSRGCETYFYSVRGANGSGHEEIHFNVSETHAPNSTSRKHYMYPLGPIENFCPNAAYQLRNQNHDQRRQSIISVCTEM